MIRFESHVFRRRTGRTVDARHNGGQANEWRALDRAAWINLREAIRATSWGLPQLMGFNYKVTVHPDPVTMALAFQRSAVDQVAGFFGFVKANRLTHAIRSGDWRTFARRYNGPGNVDHYSSAIRDALVVVRRLMG